tara:strand:- start:396 stop:671 length:276 start_codon:yes stop_codon:yes gene_type:complete
MNHSELYGNDQVGTCKDHERILSFADCILIYGYATKDDTVIKNMNSFITTALTLLLEKADSDILDVDCDYGMFKSNIQLMKVLESFLNGKV